MTARTHHVELRQFPHNACRFNMSQEELRMLVAPWAHGEWVEMGERKWSPHQAKLTVLEGPRLELEELRMGRGWRAAQRQGEDVTERVLEAARTAANDPTQTGLTGGHSVASMRSAPSGASVHDPSSAGGEGEAALARELGPLLGADPAALLAAWRLLAAADPGRRPSECLAAAERAVGAAGASES
jgi:hypothetical protein